MTFSSGTLHTSEAVNHDTGSRKHPYRDTHYKGKFQYLFVLNAFLFLQVSASAVLLVCTPASVGLYISVYIGLYPWLPILSADAQRKGVSGLYSSFRIF